MYLRGRLSSLVSPERIMQNVKQNREERVKKESV
jgi:hypothetical protein